MDSSRPSSPTKPVRVKSSLTSSVRSPPNKPSRATVRNPNLSPPSASRVIPKPQTSTSTPPTPEPSRLRSLTNTGPVPLHHALSFSSFQPSPKTSDASSTIRITSKVSGVARSVHANNPTDSTPPPPSVSQPQAMRHTRTGSASSGVTASPPVFYPITTATPAANPYRYAPSRPPAHKPIPVFATVKATAPPPSSSPPISSISTSSHSSVSCSSPTISRKAEGTSAQQDISSSSPEHSPTALSNASPINSRYRPHSSSDSLDDYDSGDDSDENKVKAAAKSNRKIADLEITNRSLMAINASLEATKHKQAKEIRELRRKLRESRLILPPRAYNAIRSSLARDDTADEADDDEDDEDEDEEEVREETDQAFSRIKTMLDNMLETGKRALDAKVSDFGGAGSAAKVLSAEEVRSWHRDSVDDDEVEPDGTAWRPSISPSRVAVPDSSDDERPPDEVMIECHPHPASPLAPPIFITPSH